jgi:hypothetical protein
MSPELTFASGLIVTMSLCAAVVLYLKTPLLKILVDLCGTESRAAFWVAFSNIVLLSVPSIFSLRSYPSDKLPGGAMFAISDQLQGGLIGLAISVIILGLVLSHFIKHARTDAK